MRTLLFALKLCQLTGATEITVCSAQSLSTLCGPQSPWAALQECRPSPEFHNQSPHFKETPDVLHTMEELLSQGLEKLQVSSKITRAPGSKRFPEKTYDWKHLSCFVQLLLILLCPHHVHLHPSHHVQYYTVFLSQNMLVKVSSSRTLVCFILLHPLHPEETQQMLKESYLRLHSPTVSE